MKIQLNPLNSSSGLPTIYITNSTASTADSCSVSGFSCGQYSYTLPVLPLGKYSVQVISLTSGQAGYSDRLEIVPASLLPAYATSGIPGIFAVPSAPGALPSAVRLSLFPLWRGELIRRTDSTNQYYRFSHAKCRSNVSRCNHSSSLLWKWYSYNYLYRYLTPFPNSRASLRFLTLATIVVGPSAYIYSANNQYISCALSGSAANCVETVSAAVPTSTFSAQL